MGEILIIAFISLIPILFVLLIFKTIRDVIVVTFNYFGVFGIGSLNQEQLKKLNKYSPYYRDLEYRQKRKFERKVVQFIFSRKFVSRGIEDVTDEMKLVVASLAVQITFGLPRIYLAHFKKILIYPDNYYSTINNQYHKGEVNPRFGIIVLSWKNLVHGIANETDGINLGLHELAHAIHLENRISNKEYGFIDVKLWKKYVDLAEYEMFKIREGDTSMFRSAAAIDHHEFFAVLLENFFERPQDLKAYSPNLYKKTTMLLKQDPIKLLGL
ncbi:zinc-dependent peptidase [Marivirga sp.]|uniref:zinc-dependent peptidase n=1 Tax=Marivirga sp. TaxID=2018662 RepID=UPI0025CD0187|nr:zinc-dependent peptidase [Marivirga sp.]